MRTDAHRLAVLDPADYRLVALQDMHEEEGSYEALDARYMDPESVFDLLDGPAWKCRICGNNHGNRYWAFFEHEPTGEVIQVGSLCAEKVGLGSRSELEKVRAHEGRKMDRIRGHFLYGNPAARQALENATRIIEEYDFPLRQDGACYLLTPKDDQRAYRFTVTFARDILAVFNREGYLSDRRIQVALKLPEYRARDLQKDAERAEREAEKRPVPVELVTTRGEIAGEVVSVKWQDSDFGGAWKVTVRDDRGFAAWGTLPQWFEDTFQAAYDGLTAEERDQGMISYMKGKKIAFQAKMVISDDDETFGFFKRPTKPKFI